MVRFAGYVGLILTLCFAPATLWANAYQQTYQLETETTQNHQIRAVVSENTLAFQQQGGQLIYNRELDAVLVHSIEQNQAYLLNRTTLEGMGRQLQQISQMYDQRRDQLSPRERQSIEDQLQQPDLGIGTFDFDARDFDVSEVTGTWQNRSTRTFNLHGADNQTLGQLVFLDDPLFQPTSDQQSVIDGFTQFLESFAGILSSLSTIRGQELPVIPGLEDDYSNIFHLVEIELAAQSIRLVDHGETRDVPSLPSDVEVNTIDDMIRNMIQMNGTGDPGGLPRPEEFE